MKGRKRVKNQQDVSAGNELTAYSNNYIEIPGNHMVQRQNQFPKVLCHPTHTSPYMYIHAHMSTQRHIHTE